MASSCDDDFGLLGDEAHQSHIHHHHHQHQQQQQLQHQHHHQQQQPVPFPLRYAAKGGGGISIHPRQIPPPLGTIASPRKSNVSVDDSYSETFAQSEVDPNNHCFAGAEPPFAPQSQAEDDDEDDNGDQRSLGDAEGAAAAVAGHPLPPSLRQQLQQSDPKRKDREEQLSDGESPSDYYKKSRPNPITPSSSGDYRKDREEWSDSAIACLLDAYSDKYVQLNRGNLRGRDWEDVATTVSERCDKHKSGKSVEQCKNKVDNLKKRYKVECQRLSSGSLAVSHWPWFKKMEQIVGSSSSSKAITDEDKSITLSGATSAARQLKRYPIGAPGSASLTNNFKMKPVSNPRWKRAVLKISAAALAGTGPQNVDPKVIMLIAREVAMASRVGVEVAIVVGGRNFFCGETWVAATGTDTAQAYQIGMMASAMNSLLLQASLEKLGVETRVQTEFKMQEIAEPYIRRQAIRHLEKGRVVIFGGIGAGMGSALLSTDAAAALRASEINADVLLKGTNTDSGFDCHTRTNNAAFEHISFGEMISRGFTAIDRTAISFCKENNIPVVFFNFLEPGSISRALLGDQVGTLIDQSGRIG